MQIEYRLYLQQHQVKAAVKLLKEYEKLLLSLSYYKKSVERVTISSLAFFIFKLLTAK